MLENGIAPSTIRGSSRFRKSKTGLLKGTVPRERRRQDRFECMSVFNEGASGLLFFSPIDRDSVIQNPPTKEQ